MSAGRLAAPGAGLGEAVVELWFGREAYRELMPIIAVSSYTPPFGWSNGHLQSVYAALCRRVPAPGYRRERIETPDGDFLDLDWLESGWARLAILSHGLEGSSNSSYIRAMARALQEHEWDVLAWNCRGCGGSPNRLLRFYHSGSSEDLGAVVRHALGRGRYGSVALLGFSLGGNLTLKWLGEEGRQMDERVLGAVTFSVPCDLAGSAAKMGLPVNRLYMWRFLRCLRAKVQRKMVMFPGRISDAGLSRMRTFKEFDDAYTAPLHGFANAEDYWRRSSSRPLLERIVVPTLLVNARNDPFLSESCFPVEEAREHAHFHFESPRSGGHVGFLTFNSARSYWFEQRALAFLDEIR